MKTPARLSSNLLLLSLTVCICLRCWRLSPGSVVKRRAEAEAVRAGTEPRGCLEKVQGNIKEQLCMSIFFLPGYFLRRPFVVVIIVKVSVKIDLVLLFLETLHGGYPAPGREAAAG